MLAMEAFNLAASTFSVVGLVDVVLRSTVQICGFLSRASIASRIVTDLLDVVRGLASVIVQVKLWANEHEKSVFATEAGLRISSPLADALFHCRDWLDRLAKQLLDFKKVPQRWIPQLKANFVFPMNEAQIRHSIEMVMYHRMTLRELVQLQAGRNVTALPSILKTELDSIRQSVADASNTIQNISSAVQTSAQKINNFQVSTLRSTLEMERCLLREFEKKQTHVIGVSEVSEATRADSHSMAVLTPRTSRPLSGSREHDMSNGCGGCRVDKDVVYALDSQRRRRIARHQGAIHECFRQLALSRSIMLGTSCQISASFVLRKSADRNFRAEFGNSTATDILLPLMQMRGRLTDTVARLSRGRLNERIVPARGLPRSCRRSGHACNRCIGPEAQRVLHQISNMVKEAHAASIRAEDTDMLGIPAISRICGGAKINTSDSAIFASTPMFPVGPFYHQSVSGDAAGILRTEWTIFRAGLFEIQYFGFACLLMSGKGEYTGTFGVIARARGLLHLPPPRRLPETQSRYAVSVAVIDNGIDFIHLIVREFLI